MGTTEKISGVGSAKPRRTNTVPPSFADPSGIYLSWKSRKLLEVGVAVKEGVRRTQVKGK